MCEFRGRTHGRAVWILGRRLEVAPFGIAVDFGEKSGQGRILLFHIVADRDAAGVIWVGVVEPRLGAFGPIFLLVGGAVDTAHPAAATAMLVVPDPVATGGMGFIAGGIGGRKRGTEVGPELAIAALDGG